MKYLVLIIMDVLMIGLFIYTKLKPHEAEIDEKHRSYFDIADKIYTPLLKIFGSAVQPYKVGEKMSVNLGELALMAAFALFGLAVVAI